MDQKKMTLDEVNPMDAEFTVRSTGKVYKIRKFSVLDLSWGRATFGGDQGFQDALQDNDKLFMIAFHQMTFEGQKDFAAVEVESMNMDGQVVKEFVGGYRRFMNEVSGSPRDLQGIAQAIIKALTGSQPIIDQINAQASGSGSEKKSPRSQTGPKSTT